MQIKYILNAQHSTCHIANFQILSISPGRVSRGQRQTNIPCSYFSHGHYEIFHSCCATSIKLLLQLPNSSVLFLSLILRSYPLQYSYSFAKLKFVAFPWVKATCFLSSFTCFLNKYILVQEMKKPNISFSSKTQTPRCYYHPQQFSVSAKFICTQ